MRFYCKKQGSNLSKNTKNESDNYTNCKSFLAIHQVSLVKMNIGFAEATEKFVVFAVF